MTGYTFQDPRPNSIRIYNGGTTEVLRISKDGVWANPDVPVDEAAQAVLRAADNLIKQMVSRAVDEARQQMLNNPAIVRQIIDAGLLASHPGGLKKREPK